MPTIEPNQTPAPRNPGPLPGQPTVPNSPSAPDSGTPRPGPRRRTLLIVDDEEGPRQSLRIVFKSEYDLLLASDGEGAIEMVKKNRVDAAVLDIRMIGMSGIELLERLKLVDPHIEIIMLTAYETIDTVRRALRLGACDYLNKPFDIVTIRAAVANAMERRSLSYEVRSNAEKLNELHSELQKQKLQEEMAKDRGEIYASIIHDINGPLTIISGLIQLINQRIGEETRVEGEDLEQVKERMKRLAHQVTNCIEISRRYLSFLRQAPGELALVWVNQILTDLGELLRFHPATRHNQLVITPLADDIQVQINGTDFIQVLLNLAINSLDATSKNHRVEIRGQLLGHALAMSHFPDGPEDRFINRDNFNNTAPLLALTVQDDGPGIPADVLPKIFDQYFTTKASGQGTGLGLAIVQRLVTQARGGLHVHSVAGQGSAFTVYLAARQAGH